MGTWGAALGLEDVGAQPGVWGQCQGIGAPLGLEDVGATAWAWGYCEGLRGNWGALLELEDMGGTAKVLGGNMRVWGVVPGLWGTVGLENTGCTALKLRGTARAGRHRGALAEPGGVWVALPGLGGTVGLERGELGIARSGAKGFGGAPSPPVTGSGTEPPHCPPSHLPKIYQALLMSATFSPDVEALKELVLHNPVSRHLGGTGVGLGGSGEVHRGRFGDLREVWEGAEWA